MRQALGTAVFFGMLGVIVFGLIFTPIFYVVIRKLIARRENAVVATGETVLSPPTGVALKDAV